MWNILFQSFNFSTNCRWLTDYSTIREKTKAVEITGALIEWDLEDEMPLEDNLWTCLTLAAGSGQLDIIKILVEKMKVDLEGTDAVMEITPLEHATRCDILLVEVTL